ncbi:MAG: RT0821/Lpp0805 family surface protein [Candidatus Berkiella sp.]
MKMTLKLPIVLLATSLFATGCQNSGKNETAATALGAVAGGIVGAQFGHGAGRIAGAAIGAVFGGLFGKAVGQSLDEEDMKEANRAFVTATRAPVGQTIYWNNARTGNWGYYRPIRDGHRRFDGYYCREFATTATINGRTERVYGTACRHPNGTWQAI